MKNEFEEAEKSEDEMLFEQLMSNYNVFISMLPSLLSLNYIHELQNSLGLVFFVKYFSPSHTYPNTVESFLDSLNQIDTIFSHLSKGKAINYLPFSILYSEEFMSLYSNIFTKSEVVQTFFTRDSINYHLYNCFRDFQATLEDFDKTKTFFQSFIHICQLPMSIKGFTNRAMQIFVNIQGWKINNAKNNLNISPTMEEKKTVRYILYQL